MRENNFLSKTFNQHIFELLSMSFEEAVDGIEKKLVFIIGSGLNKLISCYEKDSKLKNFLEHPKLFSFWDKQLSKLYDKKPEPVFYSLDLILGCYYFANFCEARKKTDFVEAELFLKKSAEKGSAYFWITFISRLLEQGEKNTKSIIERAKKFGETHGSIGYYFLAAIQMHMIAFFPLTSGEENTEQYQDNKGIRRLYYLEASAYLVVGDRLNSICQHSIENITEEGLFDVEKCGYSNFEGLIGKCKENVSYMTWTKDELDIQGGIIKSCVEKFQNKVELFTKAKKEQEEKSLYTQSI